MEDINEAAQITTADILRALSLIREASPELSEMVKAEEQEQGE